MVGSIKLMAMRHERIVAAGTAQLPSISSALSVEEDDNNNNSHILIIYPDHGSFKATCMALIRKSLLESRDSSVVINPFYIAIDELRFFLSSVAIDLDYYEKNCSLVITDSEMWFFGSRINRKAFVEMLSSDGSASNLNLKKVIVLSDIGSFFLHENIQDLISYEEEAYPLGSSVQKICLCHIDDFKKLPRNMQEKLIGSHTKNFLLTNSEEKISFEEALSQSVNEAISIFGSQISMVISNYIKNKHKMGIQQNDIIDMQMLEEVLQDVLDGGSRIVERKVLRLLYQKIGAQPNAVGAINNFEESLTKVKKLYDRHNSTISEA